MRTVLLAFTIIGVLHGQAAGDNRSKPATPPGEVIPVNESDLRIINRAAQILSGESKWNRNDNRDCPSAATTWSLYCSLYQASVEINGKFDHRLGSLEEVRRSVEQASKGKKYGHRLMGYNNDPATTFADIKKVLSTTAERIAARLNR